MAQRQLFTLAQWRAFATCLCVAMLALDVWSLCYFERVAVAGKAGRVGFIPDGLWHKDALRVKSLFPGSEMEAAGVKAGDAVIPDHRIEFFRVVGTDESVGMTVISGGVARHIVV